MGLFVSNQAKAYEEGGEVKEKERVKNSGRKKIRKEREKKKKNKKKKRVPSKLAHKYCIKK